MRTVSRDLVGLATKQTIHNQKSWDITSSHEIRRIYKLINVGVLRLVLIKLFAFVLQLAA